jgi:Tfp pilus assembly protein PilF
VAALFAVHPLNVEPVAWVAERKGVLSACFWMLTLLAYTHYVRRPGVGRYLVVALALVLGLMAKPTLLTIPGVFLLLDYWPLERWRTQPWRRLLLEKVPLFAIVLAWTVLGSAAQGTALQSLADYPLDQRIENALLSYVAYLGKCFWPRDLVVFYPHPRAGVSVPGALAAGLFLAAVTIAVLRLRRRWPYLAVGWLWYLGTLMPVIGLVQIGGHGMADRYAYIPLIGIFLMLVWASADLAATWRMPSAVPALAALVVVAACSVVTRFQLMYWQDELLLWEHARDLAPESAIPHLYLGMHFLANDMLSSADQELGQAVRLAPGNAAAHHSWAGVLSLLGNKAGALREFREAIRLDPDNPVAHSNLGYLLRDLNRRDEALAEFRRAIELEPAYPSPYFGPALVLREQGKNEEAVAAYRDALARFPDHASAHNDLGNLLRDLGRLDEARTELEEAIRLDPSAAAAYCNLGLVLGQQGHFAQAVAQLRKGHELGSPRRDWHYPSRQWLQQAERMVELDQLLQRVLAGTQPPLAPQDRLDLASFCTGVPRRYALAARLFSEAFGADHTAADNLVRRYRYRAACAAAQAGCGEGVDTGTLSAAEKAQLREQARLWLQADFDAWLKQPPAGQSLAPMLRSWQEDRALAGVRDAPALATLPEAERRAWQKLWQDVAAKTGATHEVNKIS